MRTVEGFRNLIEALGATVSDNAGLAIGAIGGMTIGNALLDHFASEQASAFIGSFIAFAAQIIVTRVATQRLESERIQPRVGGFFLLNLFTSIGVLLGLVFLILPGLYLAARWLVAGPILLIERDGVIAAMRRSWIVTAPVAWPLAGLLMVLWAPTILIALLGGFLAGYSQGVASETTGWVSVTLTYLTTSVASVGSWLAAVATFALLRPQVDMLAETFS